MGKAIEIQVEGRRADGKDGAKAKNLQRPSILVWYRILRGLFEAIRYALWLAR